MKTYTRCDNCKHLAQNDKCLYDGGYNDLIEDGIECRGYESINIKKGSKEDKLVFGLEPRYLWIEKRIDALQSCIYRHVKKHKTPPKYVLDELIQLCGMIEHAKKEFTDNHK